VLYSRFLRPWLPGAAALVTLLGARSGAAAEIHVAQTGGADTNDGSAAHPLLTISACAALAQPGDTCVVHAGTYRETVSPPRSGTAAAPIVFEAADGECPIVSGAEVLQATFTDTGGGIWVASVPDDVPQLFSRGVMIWEAQWPNRAPGALFDVPKGVAAQGTGVSALPDGGSVTTLVDPNIPAGDWTGATVFILPGARWQSDSRPVAAYDPSSHTLTLDTTVPWAERSTQPVPANEYYLFGSTLALDVQDEWVVLPNPADAGGGFTLYYDSSDDPANHGHDYKKRAYAFDLANRSYVQIVGFHVFGAAVRIVGDSNIVDSLSIEYPTHLRSFDAYYTEGDVNRILGDGNVWKNSIIEKSGSAGLIVAGNGNVIENNIANDVCYEATNHAGFDMDDYTASYRGNVFAYNTVAGSGRAGMFQYGAKGGRVLFNRVSDWALLTNDMGGIYAWGTDGEGTEIAYNDLEGSSAFWSNGVYLDDATMHFVVHHNVVRESMYFGYNIKGENEYFNNTASGVGAPFMIDKNFQTGIWQNTDLARVENDLSDGVMLVRVGVLPSVVSDYGYFEAPVHATTDWQHVVLSFAEMKQPPAWFTAKPFDLSSVQQIAFTPWTDGDFEVDVDNLRLEGPSALVLDDFESPGAANALGGYAWGGGSGDGGASTFAELTYGDGGPGASTHYGALSGTIVMGDGSYGLFNEGLPGSDLSAYTGISFDIRGSIHGLRVLATGGSPIQDHNASCSFGDAGVAPCAAGQGVVIPGVEEGVNGAAPDIGALQAGGRTWTPGAQRPSGAVCGKIADIDAALPPSAPNPWSDAGLAEVVDASAADASRDASIAGDAAASGPGPTAVGGCSCRAARRGDGEERGWLALGGVAVLAIRRRRPLCPLPGASRRA
jgi:hypothetical protein